jgi:Fe-S oxidoreductase
MQPTVQDEPFLIDDELWAELIRLTHGSVAMCYQCGTCTASCPWGVLKDGTFSVRGYIRLAQMGLRNGGEGLWLCSSCGQCEISCPRGVNIPEVFRALRTIAWRDNNPHRGLPNVLWSLYWNDNPWSQPPSQRSDWAEKSAMPAFDPQIHEVLLYVGCTSSYDPRAQKIAIALVELLHASGVKFGYLYDDEPCCGEAALSLGHTPYFNEIASQCARVFHDKGVGKVITISPHCYHVFKHHYPAFSPSFKPMHYTQYLSDLLEKGRLRLKNPLEARITYQDPCYLGRHNGEYRAPRRILESIPGVEMVEMQVSQELALCCGGGGGRMWLETDPGERFSNLRVQQARSTGAQLLATACPFCVVCLEDSLKLMQVEALQVMDVAEIAALALSGAGRGG